MIEDIDIKTDQLIRAIEKRLHRVRQGHRAEWEPVWWQAKVRLTQILEMIREQETR
jgi:hypothetical protein